MLDRTRIKSIQYKDLILNKLFSVLPKDSFDILFIEPRNNEVVIPWHLKQDSFPVYCDYLIFDYDLLDTLTTDLRNTLLLQYEFLKEVKGLNPISDIVITPDDILPRLISSISKRLKIKESFIQYTVTKDSTHWIVNIQLKGEVTVNTTLRVSTTFNNKYIDKLIYKSALDISHTLKELRNKTTNDSIEL